MTTLKKALSGLPGQHASPPARVAFVRPYKPNAQAVALLLLAAKYPDTFERLEQVAK